MRLTVFLIFTILVTLRCICKSIKKGLDDKMDTCLSSYIHCNILFYPCFIIEFAIKGIIKSGIICCIVYFIVL